MSTAAERRQRVDALAAERHAEQLARQPRRLVPVPAAVPDPGERGPLAELVDAYAALRSGLHSAALACHGLTCSPATDIRYCVNPDCVYRMGLLHRTGPADG